MPVGVSSFSLSLVRYLSEFCFLNVLNYSSNYAWLYAYAGALFDCLSFSLSAYLKVFRVWSLELLPGQTQVNITIFTLSLYKKESLRTIVNLDALKGTCAPGVSSALTHSFKASRDLFISAPSCCLSLLLS